MCQAIYRVAICEHCDERCHNCAQQIPTGGFYRTMHHSDACAAKTRVATSITNRAMTGGDRGNWFGTQERAAAWNDYRYGGEA